MFRRRGLKGRVRNTIVVHTKDNRSIRGILIGEYIDCLALAQPEFLQGARSITAGGDLIVLRENISVIQDVTEVAVRQPEAE